MITGIHTSVDYQKKQYQAVDKNASRINYLNIPKVNLKNAIVENLILTNAVGVKKATISTIEGPVEGYLLEDIVSTYGKTIEESKKIIKCIS